MAITGNIDVPGGNILVRNAFNASNAVPRRRERVVPRKPWPRMKAYDELRVRNADRRGLHPRRPRSDALLHAHGDGRAVSPFKMLWLQSSNSLACPGMDAPRLYKAMKKVPFVVNCGSVHARPPRWRCADMLSARVHELPSATPPVPGGRPVRTLSQGDQYYEAKSDEEIMVELGRRLNPDAFPWEDDVEASWTGTSRLHVPGLGVVRKGSREQPALTCNAARRELPVAVDHGGLQKRRRLRLLTSGTRTYRKYEKGMLRARRPAGLRRRRPAASSLSPFTYQASGASTPRRIHAEPPRRPALHSRAA